MERTKNQGQKLTNNLNIGETSYPHTQYKGYAEEEGSTSGNLSTSNVRSHGGLTSNENLNKSSEHLGKMNQFTSNISNSSQYQANQNQYGNMPQQSGGFQNQGGMNQYPSGGFQNQGGMNQYPSGFQNQGSMNQYPSGGFQGQSGMQQRPSSMNQYPSGNFQNQGGVQQQGQMTDKKFNDRDKINDLLASEKYLTEGYNISTFEAVNPQLQNTLKNILNETHNNRQTLYQVMDQRGWYKAENADQQQVIQAFNKFSGYKSQLPFS